MNYTSITIKDNKLGLKFGMASFRYLQGKFIDGVAFEGDSINEIGTAHILYSGYYNNCLIKEEVPLYTFEEFVDFIEENITNEEVLEQIKDVIKVWSECDIIQKSKTNAAPQAKKKSTRGKK